MGFKYDLNRENCVLNNDVAILNSLANYTYTHQLQIIIIINKFIN